MAHNLKIIDGKAQMVSAMATWHGLETRSDKMNAHECFTKSGQSVVTPVMQDIVSLGEVSKTHRALWNMHPDHTTWIATHGADYSPMEPWSMYEYFSPIIEASSAKYVTGGIIGNYEKMWSLAEMAGFEYNIGKGDNPVKKYFLSGLGYDGTLGFYYGSTDIQVVCQNTLRQALQVGGVNKFRQTKNCKTRVFNSLSPETTAAYLAQCKAEMMTDSDNMNILATTNYSAETYQAFIDAMFPKMGDKQELTPSVISARENFKTALEVAPGIEAGQTQGTFFSLIDAYTVLLTHTKLGVRDESSKLAQDLFGNAQSLRDKAVDVCWKLM